MIKVSCSTYCKIGTCILKYPELILLFFEKFYPSKIILLEILETTYGL